MQWYNKHHINSDKYVIKIPAFNHLSEIINNTRKELQNNIKKTVAISL
jgi:hypothetical protein